jgi:hypothetical protein
MQMGGRSHGDAAIGLRHKMPVSASLERLFIARKSRLTPYSRSLELRPATPRPAWSRLKVALLLLSERDGQGWHALEPVRRLLRGVASQP